ncbi:hypothetical protein HELRODRAFT_134277, partial [Helobdella robusta]|uniref:VWA N-terminal domain-containing protein n=1 Tax=Helobdella robusta TaxID=6412 RepID=T1EI39_HELRO
VMNAIAWSSHLDEAFMRNAQQHARLKWQYFCGVDGHLRIFPGVQWKAADSSEAVADLFDCRLQEWYVKAATSAKDVIILLDISGSMKGLNIEIAKTTISRILQTITADDYFNV